MEKNMSTSNGMRTLTIDELNEVSGGIWPAVGIVFLVFGGLFIEGIRHRMDPGALRREGMGN